MFSVSYIELTVVDMLHFLLVRTFECLCVTVEKQKEAGESTDRNAKKKLGKSDIAQHISHRKRDSRFECDVASARKPETLVVDQYFRFCVPS